MGERLVREESCAIAVGNPTNCTSFRFILLLLGLALRCRRNSAVCIEEGVRVAGGNVIRRVKMLSRNTQSSF